MSAQRNGMTGVRWRELMARPAPPVRYLHVSCEAYMTPDPRGPMHPAIPVIESRAGTRAWPVGLQRRGFTRNVGLKVQKRRLRELRMTIRAHRRMAKHAAAVREAIELLGADALERGIAVHERIERIMRTQDAARCEGAGNQGRGCRVVKDHDTGTAVSEGAAGSRRYTEGWRDSAATDQATEAERSAYAREQEAPDDDEDCTDLG